MKKAGIAACILAALLAFGRAGRAAEDPWRPFVSRNLHVNFQMIDQEYASPVFMMTQAYNFGAVAAIERRMSGIDRKSRLLELYHAAEKGTDEATWLNILDLTGRAFRHVPISQPMYEDGTPVTDPLVLLELGEGRCSHIARFVLDLALAAGFEARLVQLACHQVAEVKWSGRWHCLDADSNYPPDEFKRVFPAVPSVLELSHSPELLDSIPARGRIFGLNYLRTLGAQTRPFNLYYPGDFQVSAFYFGREVYEGKFYGDLAPRTRITYYYKNPGDWQADKYYGWMSLREESVPVDMVPVAYSIVPPRLIVPETIYTKTGKIVLPVRFSPAYRPKQVSPDAWDIVKDETGIRYQIRVSTKTRGWDYDFRNLSLMGKYGAGDIAIINKIKTFAPGLLGADIALDYAPELYVEVVPLVSGGEYVWPSTEVRTTVLRLEKKRAPGRTDVPRAAQAEARSR